MLEPIVLGGLSGVVVDAVGTLIEADPPVSAAYREAALRQGVDLTTEDVRSRFGQAFHQTEADDRRDGLATDESGEVQRWRGIVAAVLPDLPDPDRAFRELWDHFGRPDAWRLFDDAQAALSELERVGLAVRIGSNFDGRLRSIVSGLLPRWRDSLVISSEVGWKKPGAGFFEAACRSLGLDRSHVLVVGDDLENDYRGPRRIGMASLLLDRRGRADTSVDRIASLADLGDWIRRRSPGSNIQPAETCRTPLGDLGVGQGRVPSAGPSRGCPDETLP